MPTTCIGQVRSENNEGVSLANFSQKGNKTTSPSKSLAFLAEQAEICKVCKKVFEGKNKNGIQCNRCTAWFHHSCTNLSKPEINTLKNPAAHKSFKWFCDICDSDCEDGTADPSLGNLISRQAAHLEALTTLVMKVIEQNAEHMKQNSQILEILQKDKKAEEQVKSHVEDVLEDQKEREEKKNNLVLFNVQEGTDAEDVVAKTKEVLNFVNPEVKTDSLDGTKIKRIGIKRDNKIRPIRVIMDSQESKYEILKNSRNLKGSKFSKVGLSIDKTKKQQDEFRVLKAELDEKNKEGEGNEYTIFRNQVVKRKEIPNLSKTKVASNTGGSSNAPTGGNSGGPALSAEKKDASQ